MTIGCLEHVSLPALHTGVVWAKVDTGAFSGSLHCTNIRVVKRGQSKTRVLKFIPLGKQELATETTSFLETYVRSATGHRIKRYIIDTELELQGEHFPVRIGLADRTDMKRPMLLGRRFLRENKITVDVRINQEYDDEGENTK